jgi:putative heme-binding domain-containing protein
MLRRAVSSFLRVVLVLGCLASHPAAAQDHAGQYTQADIERGSRLYGANCAFCHGAAGDAIPNVDLRSGKFRKAVSDEDLGRVIVAGVPGTAMPPHKFQDAELTGIVAYVRSMRGVRTAAVAVGDARRGQEIFAGKGACMSCHRVNGQGSRLAPDLSDIGTIRSATALQASLLDPTANMLPINRSVRAVAKDGKVTIGRRLNEDTYSVQLIDTQERLVSLAKADLTEYAVSKTSSMPAYRGKFSAQELADVVAYLLTLNGVN